MRSITRTESIRGFSGHFDTYPPKIPFTSRTKSIILNFRKYYILYYRFVSARHSQACWHGGTIVQEKKPGRKEESYEMSILWRSKYQGN